MKFTPQQEEVIDALRNSNVGERRIAAALPVIFPGLEVTHWAIRQDRERRKPTKEKR